MAELIPISPFFGMEIPKVTSVTLEEWLPGPITSITPFRGGAAQVAKVLRPLGLGWPEPNRMIVSGPARIAFAGRDTAFLMGVAAPGALAAHAALADQSDGWAALWLTGQGAGAVLARLVPMDLRTGVFPEGSSVRSLLGHMPLMLMRSGAGFEILTFRSMAQTALREIGEAMHSVAARAALPG